MADTNKTEPCTPKKRQEARQRGEVARSMEMSAAVNLLVGLSLVLFMGGYIYRQIHGLIYQMFCSLEQVPYGQEGVMELIRVAGYRTFAIMIPIMSAVVVAALLINFSQVGFMVTPKAIQIKFSKMNPINGFKKIFGARGWAELIKSLLKIAVVATIVWITIKSYLPVLISQIGEPLNISLIDAGRLVWSVIWRLGLFFLIVGIFDLVWQRYEFDRKMRMTKQEIKDEYRQAEGDAQIKSMRRSKHRRLAQSRMAAEVAKADVVTTNPTHYAVALRYDQFRMRAPKIVAKGERLWAKLIVKIARKHQVLVIENKTITRALYHHAEVGQEIPPKLYRAVAEVLAALYKIKARRGRVS